MLIYSLLVLLLSNSINNRRDISILFSRISTLILINTIYIVYINIQTIFINNGIILFGGLLTIKTYTLIFTCFILFLTIFILGLNSVYPKHFHTTHHEYVETSSNEKDKTSNTLNKSYYTLPSTGFFSTPFVDSTPTNEIKNKIYSSNSFLNSFNTTAENFRIIEYPLIILFTITGAIFLMSSSDIISIFLSLELQSYGLYLVSSIYRNSEYSVKAGLTYFLLGGLSSCIILLGLSYLYINTGNTSLENIYMINSIANSFASDLVIDTNGSAATGDLEGSVYGNLWIYNHVYSQYYNMQLPLSIISVGFLFKIAAAPFHFWSPDVYDAIPTVVTTFVAVIPKISLLILLFDLTLFTEYNVVSLSWTNNILISSILSLIIGSILGLVQYRIKRLFAYSTISHIGFILLGLGINTLDSSRALFFYIIQYSVSNLNAFFILIVIGHSLYFYIEKNKLTTKNNNCSPIFLLSQLKGYFFINPMLAISLSLTLFSFVGVPPLVGFFGKQMILSTAIDNGYIFIVFIGILTSVISAIYYLVLVKIIFFENNDYVFNYKGLEILNKRKGLSVEKGLSIHSRGNYVLSNFTSFTISLFTLLITSFIFYDQEIIRLIFLI